MCKLLNLAVHWPLKVWPVSMIARKIARRWKGIFKIHYSTEHFIPKKYLSLVFYDNRNLKISKSKKSEQYFRDKIEIFICLFDEQLARHFEIHWRETWRHTSMILMFSKSLSHYFYHAGVWKTDHPYTFKSSNVGSQINMQPFSCCIIEQITLKTGKTKV